MRGTPIWIFILTLLSGLFLAREIEKGFLRGADEAFLSWLMRSAQPGMDRQMDPARTGIAVVAIDQSALEAGTPWPWSPLEYAVFAQAAARVEPAVVGIRPVLAWIESEERMSGVLLDRLLGLSKVILNAQLGEGSVEQIMLDPGAGLGMTRLPVLPQVTGELAGIPEFREITAAPSSDFQLAFALGFEPPPDWRTKSSIDRVPLLYRVRGEVIPSFTLQILMQQLKVTPSEVYCAVGSHLQLGSRHRIPIDAEGAFLLDRRLLNRVRLVPFDSLIEWAQEKDRDPEAAARAAELRNATLLLGRTDTEAGDPKAAQHLITPPVVIDAAVVSAVLTQHFITQTGTTFDYLVIVVVAGLMTASLRWRRGVAVAVLLGLLPLYLFGALAVFEQDLLWPPFALPLLLLTGLALLRLLLPPRWMQGDPGGRPEALAESAP